MKIFLFRFGTLFEFEMIRINLTINKSPNYFKF